MAINYNIEDVLGNKIALSILKHLLTINGATGREIANSIGYSHQATLNSLNLLKNLFLIKMEDIGRAKWYEINSTHWLIADGLGPLWNKIDSWLNSLGDFYFQNVSIPPLSIIVFGSFAKGNAKVTSDIDLLFVCYDNKHNSELLDDILNLNPSVHARFGVHASPKIISITDFKTGVRRGDGLIKNAFLEGKSIYGPSISEVLNYERKGD